MAINFLINYIRWFDHACLLLCNHTWYCISCCYCISFCYCIACWCYISCCYCVSCCYCIHLVASLMSLMPSLVTTSRMQQRFKVKCIILFTKSSLFLYHCCILSEIKLTSSTTIMLHIMWCFMLPPQTWNKLGYIWRCRKPFSQWQRSFQRKLRSHWLKFLRQRHVALVRQGPVMHNCTILNIYLLNLIIRFGADEPSGSPSPLYHAWYKYNDHCSVWLYCLALCIPWMFCHLLDNSYSELHWIEQKSDVNKIIEQDSRFFLYMTMKVIMNLIELNVPKINYTIDQPFEHI